VQDIDAKTEENLRKDRELAECYRLIDELKAGGAGGEEATATLALERRQRAQTDAMLAEASHCEILSLFRL
jgi:hypothetical protein